MARLGDIATYINGYAFNPEDWGEVGLPIIRIQDLTGNSYQLNRYSGEYLPKYEVNDGDVLISWSASLGVYVWHGEKAVLNQHIFKVVFDKVQISKNFFVYQVQDVLENAASETHGATMKHLTKPVFDALPFYLPPIKEQEEIANTLSKITILISLRQQQLEKLDQLVKSRFIEMFGDPVSNIMRWQTEKLSDLCISIYGGGTPSKLHPEYFEGSIPWVSPKDMKADVIKDSIDHITEEAIRNSSTKIVPAGAILMVIRSGILKHTLPVALAAVELTINQDMKAFVTGKRITSEYLMYYLKSIEPEVLSGIRGVTADNIDFKEFQNRQVIVPPMELQKQFSAFVTKVDKSKFEIQQSLEKLETLKKALMQKYFG